MNQEDYRQDASVLTLARIHLNELIKNNVMFTEKHVNKYTVLAVCSVGMSLVFRQPEKKIRYGLQNMVSSLAV